MAELKDSGMRQEFETGAVRDIQEGKGRCDLLPLNVLTKFYSDYGISSPVVSMIFADLIVFKDTGSANVLFSVLGTAGQGHMFSDPETMFLEVAIHYEDGARKYGDNNWQKGIPVSRYISSAIRHYLKWLRGDDDEPHNRAFVWNIMAAIWTCIEKPELNDYA